MQRVLYILVLTIAAASAAACNPFSSSPSTGSPLGALSRYPTRHPRQPPPETAPAIRDSGARSRTWRQNQTPANTVVEVESGGGSFKTVTDNTGLYGFAGLCAGQYSMTITPPGSGPSRIIIRSH